MSDINNDTVNNLRMPAEWSPHEATWIAWPHHEADWPGKIEPIHWVYADIVRALGLHERVEILCHDESVVRRARRCLTQTGVDPATYRLHMVANDRSWLRDSAPTGVLDPDGQLHWRCWRFNAWAKYDNYHHDQHVAEAVAGITRRPCSPGLRPDTRQTAVMEGGAFDTDGEGTLLVTEECLLDTRVQVRNPGLDRAGYEQLFRETLGIERVIWLGAGCAGDDTHGHVDDIARFVGPGRIVLAFEENPADENHPSSQANLRRLQHAHEAHGRPIEVIPLPMPAPVDFAGERLPASYANFYIANGCVLVPTFNDPNDRVALDILADLFPNREVVGIHARDLVWGMGTLHCLTQQQPSAAIA